MSGAICYMSYLTDQSWDSDTHNGYDYHGNDIIKMLCILYHLLVLWFYIYMLQKRKSIGFQIQCGIGISLRFKNYTGQQYFCGSRF